MVIIEDGMLQPTPTPPQPTPAAASYDRSAAVFLRPAQRYPVIPAGFLR
jgi:hypothetical protein